MRSAFAALGVLLKKRAIIANIHGMNRDRDNTTVALIVHFIVSELMIGSDMAFGRGADEMSGRAMAGVEQAFGGLRRQEHHPGMQ